MKEYVSKISFIITDFISILLSIFVAYIFRDYLNTLIPFNSLPLIEYLTFYPIYIVTLVLFTYQGIYTYRYDFWHEIKLIFKAIVFSFIIVMAYLALSKSIENYSRLVFIFSYILMIFFIPLVKRSVKFYLYKIGVWKKPAKIYGNDPFLREEISSNPYLGYEFDDTKNIQTVFINSQNKTVSELRMLVNKELKKKHEVNFIPLMNDYDLTKSHIYQLFNTRTNIIVFHNNLKSKHSQTLQQIFNYILVFLLLPIILPFIAIISIAVNIETPGPIFFKQNRVGKNGKVIKVYKFRSMYIDAKERLERLLKEDKQIKEEWEKSFKLKNDPRVTKVGKILRKTSLDELPQIFNVLFGDMNFVGPRPVLQEEIDKFYKDYAEYYFMVKPGITGLWQVSGRSDTDYDFRVKMDKWYVVNWSIWLDVVILFKTIKVVLKREGAY